MIQPHRAMQDGRIARINFMLPDDAMYPTRKSKPAPNPKVSPTTAVFVVALL
jgi:hypothetical protein